VIDPLHQLIRASRSTYAAVRGKPDPIISTDLNDQTASDYIAKKISTSKPLMVARFGNSELNCMVGCYNSKIKGFAKYRDFIKGKSNAYHLGAKQIKQAHFNAGIFPPNKEVMFQFSDLMMSDLEELDVLASWLKHETDFTSHLKHIKRVPLVDIEPYHHKDPWSKTLEGKNVLVVHPFSKTIQRQYQRRELLFENANVLPEFNLITLQSVQSAAGISDLPYGNWFEALESMKDKINKINFDIAIVGCGAYGFPLAAHAKRIGRQAVHLGGATQLLFGIKGKRWEIQPSVKHLFNEHWVRPSIEETPKNSQKVEGGCYW